MVLGSVISGWGNHCPTDLDSVADFFVALSGCIQVGTLGPVASYTEWKYHWIRLLGDACQAFLLLDDTEKAVASSIVALGHRRGQSLLCDGDSIPPSMLGLSSPWIHTLLKTNDYSHINSNIAMMRYIALKLDLRHDQCLIWVHALMTYPTPLPHVEHFPDGSDRTYQIRWVEITPPPRRALWQRSCSCHENGHTCHTGNCPCISRKAPCSARCHSENLPTVIHCPGCRRPPVDMNLTQVGLQEEYGCDNMIPGESYRYVVTPWLKCVSQQETPRFKNWGFKPFATESTNQALERKTRRPAHVL